MAYPGQPPVTPTGSRLGADRPPIEPGDGCDGQFFSRLALVVLMVLLVGASLRLTVPAVALSAGWLTTAAFHALVV